MKEVWNLTKLLRVYTTAVLCMIICAVNVSAANINGNTFPEIYVQDRLLEMTSTPIKYIENELYVPAREVMEAVGANVVWDGDECETQIDFHNYNIQLSGKQGTLKYTLGEESKTIQNCVIYVGNYNYIKLKELEFMLDIDYARYKTNNKISIRDYVPSSIEYKGKTFGKTDSDSGVEHSAPGKIVGYTKNGLEIRKKNRYFLWIIPIGYRIYVQELNNEGYRLFTK